MHPAASQQDRAEPGLSAVPGDSESARSAESDPCSRGLSQLGVASEGGESFLPGNNAGYLDMAYWNERFSKEASYEWFKGYPEFRHLLLPFLKPTDAILVLGCGNSSLTEDLSR